MMRRAILLPALALAGLGVSCGTQADSGSSATSPKENSSGAKAASAQVKSTHHLASLTFPLFPPDAEKTYGKLRKARMAEGNPETVRTDKIDWAATVDEAFARATKEDKPVLFVTFVRENGDPHCDV